jgi:hypothetical protein
MSLISRYDRGYSSINATLRGAAGVLACVAEPALRAGASGGSILAKKMKQGRDKPGGRRGSASAASSP